MYVLTKAFSLKYVSLLQVYMSRGSIEMKNYDKLKEPQLILSSYNSICVCLKKNKKKKFWWWFAQQK